MTTSVIKHRRRFRTPRAFLNAVSFLQMGAHRWYPRELHCVSFATQRLRSYTVGRPRRPSMWPRGSTVRALKMRTSEEQTNSLRMHVCLRQSVPSSATTSILDIRGAYGTGWGYVYPYARSLASVTVSLLSVPHREKILNQVLSAFWRNGPYGLAACVVSVGSWCFADGVSRLRRFQENGGRVMPPPHRKTRGAATAIRRSCAHLPSIWTFSTKQSE